ncbi:MAG: hypothetical protein K8T89_14525 [Planctomycetes bacterium]|nr:hypothetical protein [Planctomycetota bacterium]
MSATAVLAPSEKRTRTDLDQLQGSWTSVAGSREARFLIAGSRFTFEFLDGDIYMGTIFLDDETHPKQLDMLIEEGPTKVKGLISMCIYHIEGDVLRWCPTKPGSDRRLLGFPSIEDERYVSMVFKLDRRRSR